MKMDDKAYILKILNKDVKAPVNTPYKVPENYFATFHNRLLKVTGKEMEKAGEGFLLSEISKKPVFQLPEHYFRDFEQNIIHKMNAAPAARVFSLKKWYKIASAAVFAVLVTLGTLKYAATGVSSPDPAILPVAVESLSNLELIDFAEEGAKAPFYHDDKKNIVDKDQLFTDVSSQELYNFLNENMASGGDFF